MTEKSYDRRWFRSRGVLRKIGEPQKRVKDSNKKTTTEEKKISDMYRRDI